MSKGIVIFGLIIIIAGACLAFWPKTVLDLEFPYYKRYITIFPYRIVGAIVALIGFTTLVIGCYIPETKK